MGGLYGALDAPQCAPARNPVAGRNLIYPKADNKWYTKDSSGNEALVGGGGKGSSEGTGFRGGLTNMTIPYNANTAVTLSGVAAWGINSGAFSRSGTVITVNTAGTYFLGAGLYQNSGSAAGRSYLYIETWTGTDAGLGANTIIAWDERNLPGPGYYTGLNCHCVVPLAAGAKLRVITYQSHTAAGNSDLGTIYDRQLNIFRVDSDYSNAGPGGPVARAQAPTSVTAATNINYATELEDSHNAMSAGVFSVPFGWDGLYSVSAQGKPSTATAFALTILSNSTAVGVSPVGDATTLHGASISRLIRMTSGNTISIQSSATYTPQNDTGGSNFVDIAWIRS